MQDTQNQPLKGVIFMIIQTMMLLGVSITVKLLTELGQHPIAISFWRSAFMLIPIFIALKFMGRAHLIKTANKKRQISRAVLGTLTMLFMFITYSYVPLTQAQSLFFTTPLFVILLSYPVLKEKVGIYRTSATIVGFAGMLIMLQPGAISSPIGAAFGILSAISLCGVTLLLRTLGKSQDAMVTIFYFALIGLFMMLIPLPFYWKTPDSLYEIFLLIWVSAFAFGNQYFLTRAIFCAPPSITSPMTYVGLIWALIADITIWGTHPGYITLIGAAIVISANIFIVLREQASKRIKT